MSESTQEEPLVDGGERQGDVRKQEESTDRNPCLFQEHEPLYHLLGILPHRAQKGFFSLDIEYTTIDVSKEFIALGTTVGVIFLYDRLGLSLQKLNTNNKNETFVSVCMQQSVDYVVAGGTASGHVYIFQLPSYLPGRAKQLHMSTIQGLHVGKVSSLEWSQNTQKLFSGDQDGNVVCTEMDYIENKSQSYIVCQEPHPIVQLSYAYRTLLVSTTFRTVLCTQDKEKKVKKIGTKDRKILGDFGACLMPGAFRPEDAILYAARPGLRLWRANITGKVETTYMFRDLLHGKTPMIAVLPDTICDYSAGKIEEVNFGQLYAIHSNRLVTWSGGTLFVVDPREGNLIGWVNNLGHIQGISVCEDEVFILRHGVGRRIVRIAECKDPLNENVPSPSRESSERSHTLSSSPAQPTSPVQLFQQTANVMSYGIMDALRGVGEKIQSVQEGQQMLGGSSTVPPWGYAPGVKGPANTEENDVDSCKEASSHSSMSSSLHDDTNSPSRVEAQQEVREEVDESQHKVTNATTRKQDQPEIRLESDDVISVHIPHSLSDSVVSNATSHRSTGTADCESKDIISSFPKSGSSTSQDIVGRRVPYKVSKTEDLDTFASDPSNSIVFSPKPKKGKKKKHKGTSKLGEETQSHDSMIEGHSLTGSHASSGADDLKCKGVKDSQNALKQESVDTDGSKVKVPIDGQSQACLPAQVLSTQQANVGKNAAEILSTKQGNVEKNAAEILSTKQAGVEKKAVPAQGWSTELPEVEQNVGELEKKDPVRSEPSTEGFVSVEQEAGLPPMKELASLGISPLSIGTDANRKSQQSEKSLGQSQNISETRKESVLHSERAVSRPVDLPSPGLSLGSPHSLEGLPHWSSSTSPKPALVSIPSYERSPSMTSLTDREGVLTSSFHADNNKASFESYAHQSSLTESTPETPSPKKAERQQFYQTSDSSDDFYSKFQHSVSTYSLEDMMSPERQTSIEEAMDYRSHSQSSADDSGPRSSTSVESASAADHKVTDTWTEFLAPGNLYSMCLTERHIWVVDKSERLHYSSLSGPGLTWRKVDEPARQIAVSPSGGIVWRLYHGSVYAGTKITTRAPAGLNWVEVLRKEVAYISVDNTTAWYIKNSGEVMVQRGLSRDRPSFRSMRVPCKVHLAQIACRSGVVWGVSDAGGIMVRTGITNTREEGIDWQPLEGEGSQLEVADVSLGTHSTVWVMDTAGSAWFTTGVTQNTPSGSGKWWQVSMSEYLMQDVSVSHALADLPQNITKLVSPVQLDRGGLITTGSNGIWASPGHKHVLQVCRGSIIGHRWNVATPSGMANSAKWLLVSANAASKAEGLIWAQQPNGAIFCFPTQGGKVTEVSQPPQEMRPFICLSATTESVWGLTEDGRVYIRKGMASHCPHGLNWVSLDLMQLGSVQLIHLSSGTQNVWAVDHTGMVYLRIGNRPPTSKHLNPAWVPVEGTPHHAGARFTQVHTGISEWMVWAIDNRKCVYVRKGVSDAMPIGTHWLYVPGTPADDLVMSEHMVYALNPSKEILVRHFIEEDNPAGDYWKKIPGIFRCLSVTATDNLWGINTEGQLCHRETHLLPRKQVLDGLTPTRANVCISEDWEVI